jgi:hypothetical protein
VQCVGGEACATRTTASPETGYRSIRKKEEWRGCSCCFGAAAAANREDRWALAAANREGPVVTRAEAFQTACDILDDLAEREFERYLDRHSYDAVLEDELRREVAVWRAAQIDEITKLMDAIARSMLH